MRGSLRDGIAAMLRGQLSVEREMAKRVAMPAAALVEQAQVPMRVGEIGVGADRLLVARQRIVRALEVLQHDTEVVPRERARRIVSNRFAEVRLGADEVRFGVEQAAEIDARDDARRIE